MNAFHISDKAGDVVLEHIIFVGPVRYCQNGCSFKIACAHAVEEVYAMCPELQPNDVALRDNWVWFNDRRTELVNALNSYK